MCERVWILSAKQHCQWRPCLVHTPWGTLPVTLPVQVVPLLEPKSTSSAPHLLMGMCSLASWIFKSTSNSACLCVFSSPGAPVLQFTKLSIPRPCSLTLMLWLWTCVEDPPSRFLCYCCCVLHLGFQMVLLQDIPLSEKFPQPALPAWTASHTNGCKMV